MNPENEIPNSLERFKGKNPLKVPAGYFDSLTHDIQSKKSNVSDSVSENFFVRSSFQKKLLMVSMALVLLVTIGTIYVISSAPIKFQFASTYSSDQIDEIILLGDEDLIIEQLANIQTEPNSNSSTQNQEVIDYLLNENIDIESVIDEL